MFGPWRDRGRVGLSLTSTCQQPRQHQLCCLRAWGGRDKVEKWAVVVSRRETQIHFATAHMHTLKQEELQMSARVYLWHLLNTYGHQIFFADLNLFCATSSSNALYAAPKLIPLEGGPESSPHSKCLLSPGSSRGTSTITLYFRPSLSRLHLVVGSINVNYLFRAFLVDNEKSLPE